MIKSIYRNSDFYKNVNNIGVLYEYIGNNSFTEQDLKVFAGFLQQTGGFGEIFIQTVGDKKKYYISFFLGEKGYSNNYNNINGKLMSERTALMQKYKPKFEKLGIFEGRLLPVNLKLYNLDEKDDNVDYVNKVTEGMNEDKTHLQILKKYFQEYIDKNIGHQDYKDYILQNYFMKNSNLDFYETDQEIFEPILNFANGNKFFLFPFYMQGLNQKMGDNEFQKLDLLEVLMFLDEEKKVNFNEYLLKVSISPNRNVKVINESSGRTSVIYDGEKSYFDLKSVNDEQNMFFDFTFSLFIMNNKPDISGFLNSWTHHFEGENTLIAHKVTKEFNEMYLSHNNFTDIGYIGHSKNIGQLLETQKEYLPFNKHGTNIGAEYFSNNPVNINFFDMVTVDKETGELNGNANGWIVGNSGAGKTYFGKEYFKRNKTEQIIVFDNMNQFRKIVTEENIKGIKLLEYGHDFPNLIGDITAENISNKQGLLYQIIIGLDSELSGSIKENFRGVINMFIETIIDKNFYLKDFITYVEQISEDVLLKEEKRLLLNKLNGLNTVMKSILNNSKSLLSEMLEEQKVIFSYSLIAKEADKNYQSFLKSILLDATVTYLVDKKAIPIKELAFPYTTVLVDEAHNMFGEYILEDSFNKMVRQIRNFRANVISISQSFNDFEFTTLGTKDSYYVNSNFYVMLSPDTWEQYKGRYGGLDSKRDLVIKNLEGSLAKIAEQYSEDQKNKNKEEKDKVRYCVFNYRQANSFFILNTNKKLDY